MPIWNVPVTEEDRFRRDVPRTIRLDDLQRHPARQRRRVARSESPSRASTAAHWGISAGAGTTPSSRRASAELHVHAAGLVTNSAGHSARGRAGRLRVPRPLWASLPPVPDWRNADRHERHGDRRPHHQLADTPRRPPRWAACSSSRRSTRATLTGSYLPGLARRRFGRTTRRVCSTCSRPRPPSTPRSTRTGPCPTTSGPRTRRPSSPSPRRPGPGGPEQPHRALVLTGLGGSGRGPDGPRGYPLVLLDGGLPDAVAGLAQPDRLVH